jgi:hypothetical protein
MPNTSSFQQAIETVEALPLEDQIALLDLLHHRLQAHRRQALVQHVTAAEQDYATGNFHRGSVADLMAELDDECQALSKEIDDEFYGKARPCDDRFADQDIRIYRDASLPVHRMGLVL